jgi:predicted translin family RNA/ssDNA-binding protein
MIDNDIENVEGDVVETKDFEIKDTSLLSAEQEIGALRTVHEFLSEFDRVPGSLSSKWSQMLDTIAVVANSLIGKLPKTSEVDEVDASPSEN